jgi:hypothetical protein
MRPLIAFRTVELIEEFHALCYIVPHDCEIYASSNAG